VIASSIGAVSTPNRYSTDDAGTKRSQGVLHYPLTKTHDSIAPVRPDPDRSAAAESSGLETSRFPWARGRPSTAKTSLCGSAYTDTP
jgi:hypothetical protein